MAISIENEISEIKRSIPKLEKLSEEYLFSLVCYKFFLKSGFLSYQDYISIFVDGRADGGIDLVDVIEDSSGQLSLNMIQSKKILSLGNYNDVIDMVRKIITTHNDFRNGNTTKYSKKLRQKFQDKLAEIEESATTNTINIFLGVDLSHTVREKINMAIAEIPYFDEYDISIFDKEQIVREIEAVLEPKRYVDEGKIRISKEAGKIQYGANGILVNVYASSLKELYERFRDRGLFEQNFRYFVKNKKIDDNIRHSLSSKRDRFWFLNNGIIIGCKDFNYDSTNVKLYEFSIINGCQTTSIIGEFDGISTQNDFVLPCKIVKPEKENDSLFDRFISEIAESSNSQKPISDRDLKSNMPEQINLKRKLAENDPKVFLEIKRGERKEKHSEKWQTISNDLYGQLVLAFHFQQPGTARSFKKKIFGDENLYSKIFKREIDKGNIVDLLKLHYYYETFIDGKFSSLNISADYENIATSGKLVILALISFLIKLKRGLIKNQDLAKSLQVDNIRSGLFVGSLPDNFNVALESLLIEIIGELVDVYNRKEDTYKTVANFFKLDKYYHDDIVPHFYQRYQLNPRKKEEIDQLVSELFS